ncbi:hypothetical protein P8452_01275 [Trifolium repens]|nr:hypothetical protein P8452_01275 [Trifolium repens]
MRAFQDCHISGSNNALYTHTSMIHLRGTRKTVKNGAPSNESQGEDKYMLSWLRRDWRKLSRALLPQRLRGSQTVQ